VTALALDAPRSFVAQDSRGWFPASFRPPPVAWRIECRWTLDGGPPSTYAGVPSSAAQRQEAAVAEQEVTLGRMTRREFREALERGWFRTAIVATGSIEQHLEHLAMDYDISAATWVAEQAARRLHPQVVVAAPVSVGISEHHMLHKGTLTAKPGSWLAVVFDAVESLVRHGVRNVLILNGHGGNEAPVYGILRQWQLYFQLRDPEANVQFHSYWNLSRAEAEQISLTGVPGHATEYETSMALALFPEKVRHDALRDQEEKLPLEGTAEKGARLAELAVTKTVAFLEEMIAGGHRDTMQHLLSRELNPLEREGG
jgi:creatinine amidohydrolase